MSVSLIDKIMKHKIKVVILPTEEKMYSRKEVIELLNAYGNAVALEFSDCDCDHTEPFSFEEEDWIKENL